LKQVEQELFDESMQKMREEVGDEPPPPLSPEEQQRLLEDKEKRAEETKKRMKLEGDPFARRGSSPDPRTAMPEDYEDEMNPVPDRVQDRLDNLDGLELEELESLADEVLKNEYGSFEDLYDTVQDAIRRKEAELEDYEVNRDEYERETKAEFELERMRNEGERPPTRFGRQAKEGDKDNEYAICTVSVGREDESKYKECKESVKKKKSSLGDKRMSSQLKPAIRTARSLMAEGKMGSELWHQIQQAHPHLSPDSKNRLAAFLRKEIGFLGQVAHNPNLYPTCKTARIAKERHPRKEGLILTYRTPMCGSCSHNKASRCALMGGRLVAGVEETPETAVVRTANRLVNQETLSREEANRISKAKASAGQRVAALNILATQRVEDPNKDIEAVQGSRQAASILDPAGNSMEIPAQSRKGPGRVANSDQHVGEAFDFHAGDEKVSKGACRVASLLNPAEIPVEVPDRGAAPRTDVQMDPFATFTVPKRERGTRSASAVAEESVDQAHQAYNKYARLARKLLSSGYMTTEIAARLYGRMDELKQFGVVPSESQSRVATQVGALAGHLEM
jgi:hypothetical protein